MDNYSTIKDATTTLGLSLSPGDMTTNQVNAAPTFLQSLRRNKVVMAFVTVSVVVLGMKTGGRNYASSSSNNTMIQASIDYPGIDECPDLYTFCQGQPKCETTKDCPLTPKYWAPFKCNEGSCYMGPFPFCLLGSDGTYKVECN